MSTGEREREIGEFCEYFKLTIELITVKTKVAFAWLSRARTWMNAGVEVEL